MNYSPHFYKKMLIPPFYDFSKIPTPPINKGFTLCISKTIKICPNQYTDLLRFLFKEDFLTIKKVLELVSWLHFSYHLWIKNFLFQYYRTSQNIITRLCLFPKLFSKMCFEFHASAFDDVMTFEFLKS